MPAGWRSCSRTTRRPGHAIHALYPQNRFLSSRVRVFIDYLAEIYGPVPPWERGLKVKLPEVRAASVVFSSFAKRKREKIGLTPDYGVAPPRCIAS